MICTAVQLPGLAVCWAVAIRINLGLSTGNFITHKHLKATVYHTVRRYWTTIVQTTAVIRFRDRDIRYLSPIRLFSPVSVSELTSSIPKSEEGHHRSESSSDSFVCVSEATSNDTHIDRAASQDPDTWVYLQSGDNGHGSQQSPQEEKEEATAKLAADVQKLALLDDLGEVLETDGGGGGQVEEQEEETEKEMGGGGGDSGSDWENWDD